MLVSHRKKFIYTKTFKTASTSVEVYFEPYCVPDGSWHFSHYRDEMVGEAGIVGYRGANPAGANWVNHMPAEKIRQQLGASYWAEYYKFCTIRNPFDKLVSAFHFMEQLKQERNPDMKPLPPAEAHAEEKATLRERFHAWVLEEGLIALDRDIYMIDNKLCMDYFIRQEDLVNGIKHVCQVLEIPLEPERIPRLKADSRPSELSLGHYYDEETIAIVAQRYEFELQFFNYSFSPHALPNPASSKRHDTRKA